MTAMNSGSPAPVPPRSPTRVTVFLLLALVLVVAALVTISQIVKATQKPGPLDELAARADCQDFEWEGAGFADSTEGHCTVDAEAITLVTFDSDRDRDRWVAARLTFGRLTVGGPSTWIVRGDRWAIETSSLALGRRLADKLHGTIAV